MSLTLNSNPFVITDNGQLYSSAQMTALSPQTLIVVNTVDDLSSIPTIYTTAIVKDNLRGGIFNWSLGGTIDGGITFAGVTGVWVRQWLNNLCVDWFGAKGDSVTDDTAAIQKALDFAMRNHIPMVYLRQSSAYVITNTLHIGYGDGFRTITLSGFSRPGLADDFTDCELLWQGPLDRPAINIQGGRGSGIENLQLIYYFDSFFTTIKDMASHKIDRVMTIANWYDNNAVVTEHNAFCGVAIDAYSGAAPSDKYPTVTYPSWTGLVTQYNKALSSRCKIKNCVIRGFYIGVYQHPSAVGSGDFTTFESSNIEFCAYGVWAPDQESRLNNFINSSLSFCYTGFTNIGSTRTGNNTCTFSNTVFDNSYRAFNVYLNNPMLISNCYFESTVTLGIMHSGAGISSAASFNGCTFNHSRVGVDGSIIVPVSIADVSASFDACLFMNLYGIELFIDNYGTASPSTFKNCVFNNHFVATGFPTAAAPESIGMVNVGGVVLSGQGTAQTNQSSFKGCKFGFQGGNVIYSPGIDLSNTNKSVYSTGAKHYNSFINYVIPPYMSGVTTTLSAVSVSGLTVTATAATQYTSPPQVGDVLSKGSLVMLVQAYNAGAITLLICNGYTVSSTGIITLQCDEPANTWYYMYRPGKFPNTGTGLSLVCTSGSANITMLTAANAAVTDVTPYYSNGDTLLVSATAYAAPVNTPVFTGFVTVIGASGSTITVNKNALKSATIPAVPSI